MGSPPRKTSCPAPTKHLKNIFKTRELKEEVVSSILEHTTQHGEIEGKRKNHKISTPENYRYEQ